MQKIIKYLITYILLFRTLFAEISENGSLSFDGIGFFINNIEADWSSNKSDYHFNGKLKTFELGFKRSEIEFSDSIDKKILRIYFQGPELSFLDFNLTIGNRSPDWIQIARSSFREQYQKPAVDGIDLLSKAMQSFTISEGRQPEVLEELISKKYINLATYPFNDNRFSFSINSYGKIKVTTPSRSKSRSDQVILYDTKTRDISGDYIARSDIDTIAWQYNINVKEISQTFSSEASLSYSQDSSNFEFLQKRGRFKISGVSLEAIPGSNINDLGQFRLNDILLETSNINMFGFIIDSIPKVDHGKGHFTMRNLEINIPTSLSDDIEINYLLEQLGIWNGVLKVRLIDFEINLLSSRLGEIRVRLQTPFLSISLDGDISLSQNNNSPKISFQQTDVRIKPVSLGVRTMIRKWEKNNELELPRKNGVIMLRINGPVFRPQIDGIIY